MIKIGIVGYGNLGRGVEKALMKNDDMECFGVFSRRDPEAVTTYGAKVYRYKDAAKYRDEIDVMILCGGSATDIEVQAPEIAYNFCTVDAFDTHKRIPEHYEHMRKLGEERNTLSLISTGWDPGLFSLMRTLFEAVLPDGKSYTFWGKGVSQGHSDAVRRIPGVLRATQYTIPSQEAMARIEAGESPDLTDGERHSREVYVVTEEGADQKEIEQKIVTMKNYFEGYKTTVHFISMEEWEKNHRSMPHGGKVLRNGETSEGVIQHMGFSLNLDSNPEFTGSILVAFARAVNRLRLEGHRGAMTILDVPIGYLNPKTNAELLKHNL